MGIYPCQSEGDEVILYDPDQPDREIARLQFTTVIGSSRKDLVCAAQYFQPKSSGKLDAIGLQLTTGGIQVERAIAERKAEGDSEACLLLQGLADRIAEDMAEHLHQEQRRLMGAGTGAGQRWSPGYPGMRNIAMNGVILKCLQASELTGVVLTEACEFMPTGTTAAAVSFHPDARYM